MTNAVRGFLVALRYQFREVPNSLKPRWVVFSGKVKDLFWNALTSLKRIVRGRSIGILRATPNPVEVSDISGTGTVLLKWQSFLTKKVELHIDSPDGQIIHSGNSSGSFTTGNWIANDMVFYLQDISGGMNLSPSNTLSKVTVKVTNGNKITI